MMGVTKNVIYKKVSTPVGNQMNEIRGRALAKEKS